MKKILLFALTIGALTFGSTSNAQIRFGIKGGLNVANVSVSQGTAPDSRVGFHVGALVDIPLIKILSIQPAVLFSTKGYKQTVAGIDFSSSPSYIDIPVNLALGLPITDKIKLVGLLGPQFSLGVGGKFKSGSEEESIKYGSGDDANLKSTDFGVNFGAGVDISNLQILLSYQLGLMNVNPGSGAEVKNRVFGVSLAYLFGGKNN